MSAKSTSLPRLGLALLAVPLLLFFAYLAYAASFYSSLEVYGSPGIVQAGAASQLFNFSVNNTDSSQNVTQVQISLPSGFNFISNSNGMSAERILTI